MKKFKNLLFYSLVAVIVGVSITFNASDAMASANVNQATGGNNISLDNSAQATGGGNFIVLGNITIAESALGEIGLGAHTFSLPTGWAFDTSVQITMNANWAASGLFPAGALQFLPSATSFSVEFASVSWQAPATLTFSGLRVKPTGTVPSGPLKITHTQGTISGVTNGTSDGIIGTNFGFLKAIAGSANKIVISDPADATAGGTTNITITVQDQFGNRVSSANDQAVTVSVSGSARISGVTTGAGDGAYNSISETITSNGGQIIVTVTDATAETINIDVTHATLDHSSTQNVVFAAAPQPPAGGGAPVYTNYGTSSGGGTTYTTPANPDIQTTSRPLSYASADGTQVNGTITTTSNRGALTETALQANISLGSPINNSQPFTLNISGLSSAREAAVILTSDFLRGIVASYGGGRGISLTLNAHAATNEQKSESALNNLYLFDYLTFSLGIAVDNNSLTTLSNPVQLSFDVSNIEYPREVSIARYDRTNKQWVDLGAASDGARVSVAVNQTGDYGVIRTLEQRRRADNLRASSSTAAPQQPQAEVLGVRIANGLAEADYLAGAGDVNILLASINGTRNLAQERAFYNANTKNLIRGIKNLTAANINSYTNFIAYGSASTLKLGAGERAGVLNSYKAAFGKLPVTARDWQDIINIATGRWTAERSTTGEANAARIFRQIYLRQPNLTNARDEAAINVIAYGLRPSARNLQSEQAAIRIFRNIFRHNPSSATDWDATRAIAYSGATR